MSVAGVATARQRCRHQRHPLQGNHHTHVISITPELLLHTFNGPLSRTTRVSQYQKGKTNLDFTEARDSEWQWHRLGHMQVCTSLTRSGTGSPG